MKKQTKNKISKTKIENKKNVAELQRQAALSRNKVEKPKDPVDRDSFDSFPASDPATKY